MALPGFVRKRPWLRSILKVWSFIASITGALKTILELPKTVWTVAGVVPALFSYLVVYFGYAVAGWVALLVASVAVLWIRVHVDSQYASRPAAADWDDRLTFRLGVAAAFIAIPITLLSDPNRTNEAIFDNGISTFIFFGTVGFWALSLMVLDRIGAKSS
jgi:hypothetical protein